MMRSAVLSPHHCMCIHTRMRAGYKPKNKLRGSSDRSDYIEPPTRICVFTMLIVSPAADRTHRTHRARGLYILDSNMHRYTLLHLFTKLSMQYFYMPIKMHNKYVKLLC